MTRWTAFLVVLLTASSAHAVDSVRLTDVVRSTGIGNIDLFKDTTSTALEAFRSDGGGALRVAVDVNEAADGSEKSTSQAVTLESVTLSVRVGGTDYVFSEFSSATQALLAASGTTQRLPYYTLLGDSGSNRITSNTVQERFDSIITIPVDVDLSQATTATLDIRFLEVNKTLGDPERFYDFSNGFEDLALVNSTDHAFISDLAPGQDEAPAVVLSEPPPEGEGVVGWLSYPSSSEYYSVGFEDLFPSPGDYDFNDLVVAYRVDLGLADVDQVKVISGAAFPLARGAGYSHDFHLRFEVAGGGQGTIEVTVNEPDGSSTVQNASFSGDVEMMLFDDTRMMFPPADGYAFTNTEPASPFVRGPRVEFTVVFDDPVALSALSDAPFDPFIEVRNTGYEVHLPGNTARSSSRNASEGLDGFRDARGFPFAMPIPLNWRFPWERVDLGIAYPRLATYVTSLGTSELDWYAYPTLSSVRSYGKNAWEW
jgi:LruC domain-containing protein